MSIADRYLQVTEEVEKAALQAGREPQSVKLIAVTKYVEPERIAEAFEAGAHAVGENHAQEVREKLTFYKEHGAELHFIGQLQTNKIKYIIGNAACIQSVDRIGLAEALGQAAEKKDVTQDILLQVNIGSEPQKGGVLPDELPALLEAALRCPRLTVKGLMCVPPAVAPEEARKYFAMLRELRDRLSARYPGVSLGELSMGMSADYREAVLEGATMVRVGSAIFGARDRK